MPDKDHDKDKDKHDKDRREAEQREHDQHAAASRFDNPAQDPNHPSNKTLSPERPQMQRSPAEAFNVPADQLMTAQEADTTSEVHGVGPVSPAEVSPGPVETIQDQGIGPRTPYPTGDPPPPSESMSRGQGIKGVTDQPALKPGETKGPGGRAEHNPPPPGAPHPAKGEGAHR